MRIALAIVAAVLWAGAAYGQADVPHSDPVAQSAPEPSSSQGSAANPSGADQTTSGSQSAAPDRSQQIVCHTTVAVGSRLARHATRVCKTRGEWELEEQQNQEAINHHGMVNPTAPNQ